MDPKLAAEVQSILKNQSDNKIARGAPANRSDSTVTAYIRQLSHVYKEGEFGPEIMEKLQWIESSDAVIAVIEGLTTRNGELLKALTEGNYAASIAILTQHLGALSAQGKYTSYI
jgi:hypothetical protein